jgi:hypothetical protein
MGCPVSSTNVVARSWNLHIFSLLDPPAPVFGILTH